MRMISYPFLFVKCLVAKPPQKGRSLNGGAEVGGRWKGGKVERDRIFFWLFVVACGCLLGIPFRYHVLCLTREFLGSPILTFSFLVVVVVVDESVVIQTNRPSCHTLTTCYLLHDIVFEKAFSFSSSSFFFLVFSSSS